MGGGLEEQSRCPNVGGLVVQLHDKPVLELTRGVGQDGVVARLTAHTLQGKNVVNPGKKLFFSFCGYKGRGCTNFSGMIFGDFETVLHTRDSHLHLVEGGKVPYPEGGVQGTADDHGSVGVGV